MNLNLENSTALVTASSDGIGQRIDRWHKMTRKRSLTVSTARPKANCCEARFDVTRHGV